MTKKKFFLYSLWFPPPILILATFFLVPDSYAGFGMFAYGGIVTCGLPYLVLLVFLYRKSETLTVRQFQSLFCFTPALLIPLILLWVPAMALVVEFSNRGSTNITETVEVSIRIGMLASALATIIGYLYVGLVFTAMHIIQRLGKFREASP